MIHKGMTTDHSKVHKTTAHLGKRRPSGMHAFGKHTAGDNANAGLWGSKSKTLGGGGRGGNRTSASGVTKGHSRG